MACLSIIIPAYDEEAVIETTEKTIAGLMEEEKIDYELVFVDDGSRDQTWSILEKLHKANPRITAVHFSRNFGKESAIFAGLASARGDCCIVMDCDLQHPPETAVQMYRLWEDGYEVVEAVKRSRGKENVVHASFAKLFYSIMSRAVHIDMSRASDFKLLDRKAVNALLEMPERNAFFRALSSWVGFKSTTVEFDVREREAGTSKWSVRSLIRYAITNITAFTAVPLQMILFVGIFVFLFAIVLGLQTLVRFFSGQAASGFTTVILLILFIGSILMISLGIIGYYLAKIYEEVKARPRYIISRVLSRDRQDPAGTV
ncbi:MAG: glycosyltransferase family 2 protein [Lachnospiraceae bacterium]|nr:glycosyltransferase family 2 protein [Lachnospiraceae bacterium]